MKKKTDRIPTPTVGEILREERARMARCQEQLMRRRNGICATVCSVAGTQRRATSDVRQVMPRRGS